ARRTHQPGLVAAGTPALLLAMAEIFGNDRRMLVGRQRRSILRQYIDDRLMAAVGNADMQFAADRQFGGVAPARAARADAGEIDGAVANVVIAVAAEILGRELPVARDQPFLNSTQHLGLTLAPIPTVEQEVEVTA